MASNKRKNVDNDNDNDSDNSEPDLDLPLTTKEILQNYLLGSRLYDELSLEKFRNLFPAKFRDSPDVKALHRQYQTERQQIREQIQRNIEAEVRQWQDETDSDVASATIDEAIAALKSRKNELESEVKRWEAACDAHFAALKRFDSALKHFTVPKNVPSNLLDLHETEAVSTNLRVATEI